MLSVFSLAHSDKRMMHANILDALSEMLPTAALSWPAPRQSYGDENGGLETNGDVHTTDAPGACATLDGLFDRGKQIIVRLPSKINFSTLPSVISKNDPYPLCTAVRSLSGDASSRQSLLNLPYVFEGADKAL